MRYWVNVGFLDTAQLVPVARAAERLGFEGVALPDHLVFPSRIASAYPYAADGEVTWPADAPWPDAWVAIGAMAAATERLRFTTGVFVAPLRDVFALAKSIATAAGFGPGRVSCGFGAGWLREEFEVVGRDFATRGRRMDEMIDVLHLLWTGEEVEHHGEHFDIGPVSMRPGVARVPVLVGGNTAPALRRAAANDGWIGTYTDLDDATRLVGALRAARHGVGRADDPFEVLLAALPRATRDTAALDELGVDGVILPAVALAAVASAATDDVVAGLERFAARWFA